MEPHIWDPELVIKAWCFASEAHQNQKIIGSDLPYLTHLGQVATEVMRVIALEPVDNPNLLIGSAILHDVLEDTPVTFCQLEQSFGLEIAQGVQALTKNKSLPTKADQMDDSLIRIQQQPREIWLVKLADRISNLGPPPKSWSKKRVAKYWLESMKIYRELLCDSLLSARLLCKIQQYQKEGERWDYVK